MQLGYRISIARAEECGPKISFFTLGASFTSTDKYEDDEKRQDP